MIANIFCLLLKPSFASSELSKFIFCIDQILLIFGDSQDLNNKLRFENCVDKHNCLSF